MDPDKCKYFIIGDKNNTNRCTRTHNSICSNCGGSTEKIVDKDINLYMQDDTNVISSCIDDNCPLHRFQIHICLKNH